MGVVTLTVLLLAAPAASSRGQAGMTYLDNGRIRVGVDLDDGGKVTFLAPSTGPRSGVNLVFEAEQSYAQGNEDGAIVLVSSNTGGELYTKVLPRTGPASACDCTLEQWITLDGHAVRVRNKFTNFLADAAPPAAVWNELPALYTRDAVRRLLTYTGSKPYAHRALREYTAADGGQLFVRPGPGWAATEHWAALVDHSGYGVGLFNPEVTGFAGVAGLPGRLGPNGYVTAASLELLDANATFAFEYRLVVGSLSAIRSYAYRHRPDSRPDYHFVADRQHWTYVNAHDRGFPIRGALRVHVDDDQPQLLGHEQWWPAMRVPRIHIRGRWTTEQRRADVLWATGRWTFSPTNSTSFRVRNDGLFHSYRVQLAGLPGYLGTISGLRLDPVYDGEPGRLVDITCISWKPCPVDAKAEARLVDNDLVPFLEDFSRPLDGRVWQVSRGGVGPAGRVVDGELQLGIPGTSAPDAPNTWAAANVETRCRLTRDYDLQVDFRLLSWPAHNGVTANFGVNYDRQLFRQSYDQEQLGGYFPPGWTGIEYPGLSGSFRLVKLGDTIAGSYRRDGRWERLFLAPVMQADAFAHLSLWTDMAQFAKQDVVVAFDNFRVNRGRMRCP
jgi:hypothetical protein